ncbi:uncharacterized protein V6R79_024075 [Siganus canaliculatus]
MSRPRSRSPHFRGLRLEDSSYDCYMREDMYPEDQRRPSPPSDHRHFGRQHHSDQEEFYRRRPSPHRDMAGYDERRLSPQRGRGRGDARRRGGGGFRGRFHNFEDRGRSLDSPVRSMREREPGMGWGREEPDRGRFRDPSPSPRSEDQRGGGGGGGGGGGDWDRGRRNPHYVPNRDRRREEPHHERNPTFKKPRRETDGVSRPGFRDEEDFEEQRYLVDSPRPGLGGGGGGGGDRGGSLPRGDARHSGPIVVDHDHGRETSRWEHGEERRDPDLERQRNQERFRPENRDDGRPGPFRDNWRDSGFHSPRRSPVRYDNRSGPGTHRGRGGPRPGRGRFTHNHGGRTGPLRNPPRPQQPSQGYQDPPSEDPRPGYPPHMEESYESPVQEDPDWEHEPRVHQWKQDRPRNLDQHLPGVDLDPKMPRQRMQGWTETRNSDVNVVTEETLTIKVDMSRPMNQNSSLCYSSDRQLSLDLVNVGRQRLDFLPMLEHSGTYRETATHTGTFAQEIITLVHQVKEQYFRDDGVTLNQRFSAPQKDQAEVEELTLDQRFSSNRGFSSNMPALLDDDDDEDDEPLFSQLGPLQPVRGPGDLRHDLERRRQERLEGVKVTISGNTMSQRPLVAISDDMAPMDDAEFSEWPEEQTRRRDGGDMGPRRGGGGGAGGGGGGGPFRTHPGFQRRNNRFGPRLGPMRRQNNRFPSAGPTW